MSAKPKTAIQATVDDQITIVVERLEQQGHHLVIPHIANTVYSALDEDRKSPHVIQYLSQQEIKQRVRAYLRRRYEPTERVQQAIDEGQEDLFAETLQDYYPVKRVVMGKRQGMYVKRDDLVRKEVDQIACRLSKAGHALVKHADGLIAWDRSRSAD